MNLQQLNSTYSDLTQYIDIEDGLNRIQKNKKVYGLILNSFVKNTYYGELQEQLAKGDLVSAQRAAHTIKGLAANLSLPLIYEISADIDMHLKSGKSNILTELEILGDTINKTVEYIEIVLQNLEEITF